MEGVRIRTYVAVAVKVPVIVVLADDVWVLVMVADEVLVFVTVACHQVSQPPVSQCMQSWNLQSQSPWKSRWSLHGVSGHTFSQ